MKDYAPTWRVTGLSRQADVDAAREIPGVRFFGGRLFVPDHARGIVAPLIAAGRWEPPKAPPKWKVNLAVFRESCVDMVTGYQWDGVDFITNGSRRFGGHLWWPGGAGKTLAACLWAACCSVPTVVVTKASARGQYANEIRRFTNVEPFVVRPSNEYRKKDQWGSPADYLGDPSVELPYIVIGWEALPAHWELLEKTLGRRPFNLVLDEIHKAKSYRRSKGIVQPDGSKKWVAAGNIVDIAARLAKLSHRRLGTTATPVKDRVRDLWAQLDLVEPWSWGSSKQFVMRYADARPGKYGGLDTTGSSNMEELAERTAMVAHRLQPSDLEGFLPAVRREFIRIPFELLAKPSANAASDLAEQRRLTNERHAAARIRLAASQKRPHIIEAIDARMTDNTKVVVFAGLHVDCDNLAVDVRKAFRGVQVWCAHGGNTTPSTRERVRVEYMEHPGPCILVGTGDAWGTGSNLQDTDVLILGTIPFTGGDLHQWERRVSRLGHKGRSVRIVFLIAEGTIDESIADNLRYDKLPAMEQIVGDTATASVGEGLVGLHDREAVAAKHLSKLRDILAAMETEEE